MNPEDAGIVGKRLANAALIAATGVSLAAVIAALGVLQPETEQPGPVQYTVPLTRRLFGVTLPVPLQIQRPGIGLPVL